MKHLILIAFLIPAPLMARADISEISEVTEGLIVVGMADTIRKECDTIKPRIFRAIRFIRGLESTAKSHGYSNAEVKAYVDNDTEKARLLGIARARLTELGALPDQPTTLCTVGLAQIAAGTAVGNLLKAK